MFKFIGFWVITGLAVLLFCFYISSLTPYVEAQHGMSGRYSNTWVTDVYEEISASGTTVKTITSGNIITSGLLKTNQAAIKISGQGVRFTLDGSTPSTSLGVPLSVGDWLDIEGITDIQNFKFVNNDDTGTAIAHIHLKHEAEMNWK